MKKLEYLDAFISFDDTGSMSSVRKQVRNNLKELIKTLFDLIPNLRIGIVIHNDYCDGKNEVIRTLDLTNDQNRIESFVNIKTVEGGGDAKECYALALKHINDGSWTSPNKIAIMIGDERPHEKGERSGGEVEQNDWRAISKELGEKQIPIYAIQCLSRRSSDYFYDGMAKLSGGLKLELSQFGHITDYILAIAHQQNNTIDEFQNSKSEFKTNISLKNMFNKLRKVVDIVAEDELLAKGELLSRFQVVNVDYSVRISEFVNAMGLRYRAGKGYYEFVNSEIIQPNKEVLFVDRETGETIMDTIWCRNEMGYPFGEKHKGKINPKNIACNKKYRIFIQSNSYTRNLDPNTQFLYELEHS